MTGWAKQQDQARSVAVASGDPRALAAAATAISVEMTVLVVLYTAVTIIPLVIGLTGYVVHYVVQGKVDHSAAIGIQNSPASRADYEHTVWRLDEAQPIVYPSQ